MRFLVAGYGSIGRRHLRNLRALGQEDLVLLRSGRSTLPEDEIKDVPVVRTIEAGLSYCLDGVAVVQRNFPFHLAYGLAERLVSSAKGVGKTTGSPCSTLSYHALFDTTVLDVEELLRAYKNFTARPFRLASGGTACDCAACRRGKDGEEGPARTLYVFSGIK